MFRAVEERDKNGEKIIHYYLTQGDSCKIYSHPKTKNGETIPLENVEQCVFKISTTEYVQEFSKPLVPFDNCMAFRLTPEESSNLALGHHRYEIEYTFLGGDIETTNIGKFDIEPQIVDKSEEQEV